MPAQLGFSEALGRIPCFQKVSVPARKPDGYSTVFFTFLYGSTMLSIGPLHLKHWLVMAPMAGITDLPFRLLVKGMGAALVTSEMVSARGLCLAQRKTCDYVKTEPREHPLAIQIFGSDPGTMAGAAEQVAAAGAALVDINMGCPARKVTKTGAGGALLRNLPLARKIMEAVRRASPLPLTVKIRAGWSPDQNVSVELARMIEDCGADALTVHPRFVTQGFSGSADWRIIGEIKKSVRIPVIGNGDVIHPSSAFEMKRMTGCDGVMVGRGAVCNPWIFQQIEDMERGTVFRKPSFSERKSLIEEHFRLLCSSLGEVSAGRSMRGILLRTYTKGLPGGSRFRESISRIKDHETLVSAVDDFFSSLEDADS
jgi:tRNA-dihydrouridine synthase B